MRVSFWGATLVYNKEILALGGLFGPLLLAAKSNSEMVEELHISVKTIKTHLRNICRKTKVANRKELLEKANRLS